MVGATGLVIDVFKKYLEVTPGKCSIDPLKKTAVN
jgi:hypothetical protein